MTMSRETYLARCQEARERFIFHGVSVNAWAVRHGFSPQTVYAILNGRCFATRGEAHRVAVALGIKRGSTEEVTA